MQSYKTLGEIGYEAYSKSTGGKTFDGRDMPEWEALPPHVVKAWEDASAAVRDEVWSARRQGVGEEGERGT